MKADFFIILIVAAAITAGIGNKWLEMSDKPVSDITLRDYLASQAIDDWPDDMREALMGRTRPTDIKGAMLWDLRCKAKVCYLQADAMILERNKKRGKK